MRHTQAARRSKASVRGWRLCISFGGIAILGGVLTLIALIAAYNGSATLYWASIALVLIGMLGVSITGVSAAKRQSLSAA